MKGWVYVLELAPSGRVKVGRTESLTKRLADHLSAAAFGGGGIARVMSFATDNPERAEREMLAMLAAHPRSRLIHGRETFDGVTFMEAAGIADQVVGYRQGSAWSMDAGDMLARCAAAMDGEKLTRVSLDHLRVLLADEAVQTNADLGRVLRRAGVTPTTVYCPVRRRTATGVKREWLVVTPAA